MAKGSFGRRATAQSARRRPVELQPVHAAPVQTAHAAPVTQEPQASGKPNFFSLERAPVDQELEDWKKARKYQLPWRQLSWIASLSFGIASFVLPDDVNGWVDWLLYGLMAASFLAGFTRRREAAKA